MAEEVYAPIIDSAVTLPMALEQVCAVARSCEQLVCGFRQVSSVVMRVNAKFVLLAKDTDEKASAVIRALCKERDTAIILIEDRKELGRIVGFVSRSDKSKVSPCGVAAVLDYGKNSEGKVLVINALRDLAAQRP